MPDRRTGKNLMYRIGDIGMAAFACFFMQSPSFLAFQRMLEDRYGDSNARTLFGMERIPCDNHIRQTLDGVPPEHFDDVFISMVRDLDRKGALRGMRRLKDRTLIALDGTEYFNSDKIKCDNCSTRTHNKGTDKETVERYHSFLGATIVAPGRNTALPLPPEFIRPQDGAKKQDCEINAVKRWLDRIGARVRGLNPLFLGDALLACQPVCEAMRKIGGNFILTAKPGSHKALYEELSRCRPQTLTRTVTKGVRKRRTYRRSYAWQADLRIRDGAAAMPVTWVSLEIRNMETGKITFRTALLTDLPVTRHNVEEIVACGRARWKCENEGYNVLKRNGYHLEHNFGHGKETLASVLAVLNLLAFTMHGACDLFETLWQQARTTLGARIRLFEHIRSITGYLVFPTWEALFNMLITGIPPPQRS